MTVTTPTLSLTLYDGSAPDNTTTFLTFRAVQSGTALTSNMYRIDSAVAADRLRLTSLESLRGAILVSATFISANYYEATVSEITALNTNMTIILKLDVASAGTVTLNISGLGTKTVSKIDSTGAVVNIASGELMVGKNYLFRYDGTQWIWVSATSADQIYIPGTVGNIVTVNSDNTLLGTTAMVVKASGAELATGTDDAKYVTSLAIKNSVNVPNVAPSTSGNVLTSNGTAWTSAAGGSVLEAQIFS